MFKIVSVPHGPIQKKIGHFVTRLMMRGPVRATAVGRSAYARMYLAGKHFAERAELGLFRRYLRPGMTVVDMGANVGFYTSPLSRQRRARRNVYAFEPDPFCAALLRERSRRMRLTNVLVENVALGAQEGEATLFCSNRDRAENCTHALEPGVPVEAIRVPVTSLDAYCRDHPIEPHRRRQDGRRGRRGERAAGNARDHDPEAARLDVHRVQPEATSRSGLQPRGVLGGSRRLRLPAAFHRAAAASSA